MDNTSKTVDKKVCSTAVSTTYHTSLSAAQAWCGVNAQERGGEGVTGVEIASTYDKLHL